MQQNQKIITEVTPLSEHDCLYIVDRRKQQFDFPIHCHSEMELNLVVNCAGCQRIVGDSVEELGYFDLAIIGPGLEHAWLQNGAEPHGNIREITVQWDPSTISETLLVKNPFSSIRKMLEAAAKGIAFGPDTTRRILPLFDEILRSDLSSFDRFNKFWGIMYQLSISGDYRSLSTSSFAQHPDTDDSQRIKKVKDHITEHFTEPLRLDDLADLVGMSPTAFSRFFRLHTNQTLQNYIIDIRLGHAIRMLVDSNMSCSEICYSCGFNNISNFNRLFKKKKGSTPMEFREKYIKNKIIV